MLEILYGIIDCKHTPFGLPPGSQAAPAGNTSVCVLDVPRNQERIHHPVNRPLDDAMTEGEDDAMKIKNVFDLIFSMENLHAALEDASRGRRYQKDVLHSS